MVDRGDYRRQMRRDLLIEDGEDSLAQALEERSERCDVRKRPAIPS